MDSNKTILIAEDDYAISLAIKTIITKSFDCTLLVAKDGELAWLAAQENDVDLIISDWNMPLKTGAQLLEDVRSHERLSKIPFLMLTARSDRDSVLDAIDAGVTEYMHKPFDRKALIERISSLLELQPIDSIQQDLGLPDDDSLMEG